MKVGRLALLVGLLVLWVLVIAGLVGLCAFPTQRYRPASDRLAVGDETPPPRSWPDPLTWRDHATAPRTVKPDPAPSYTVAAATVPEVASGDEWYLLRVCETGGQPDNWTYVDLPFWGPYQFLQSTWDYVAVDYLGRPDLVGVRPIDVDAATQTAMAHALYEREGWRPWPVCGRDRFGDW